MSTEQTVDRETAGRLAFEAVCREYGWTTEGDSDWTGLTPRLREDWRRVAAGEPITVGGFRWR